MIRVSAELGCSVCYNFEANAPEELQINIHYYVISNGKSWWTSSVSIAYAISLLNTVLLVFFKCIYYGLGYY